MKGNMERVLSTEVQMMYPKKWILLVDLKKPKGQYCTSGKVYWVANSKMEAFEKFIEIGDSLGETKIVEGFDDTPRIGGLGW